MSTVTLGGKETNTSGDLPAVGAAVPSYSVTKADLSTLSNTDLAGSRVVLNIFPSVDTPTCAASVRRFNETASELTNTKVVCISADLPFAQSRFCGSEGLSNVITGSTFRSGTFGSDFGVAIVDGPLAGLLARAVVVTDESGKVIHSELVKEIGQEPNYQAAIDALA